ncbi:MAG: radical SAM protein, partial [Proteobacteria bacterium]|nr:radical SAM protein [Pseudomonadota bacterium]
PIGLGYIAAVAKQNGHNILLLDPEAEGIDINEALLRVKTFSPDLIGLSCVTSNFNTACLWAKDLKKTVNSLLMIGGVHVTALPEKSLKDCKYIDFIVHGEGEFIVSEICNAIDKKDLDLSKITGICYRDNSGKIIKNPRSNSIKDLDKLPWPYRDSVDLNWYRLQPHFERGKNHATIVSSRGCPSSCVFCGNIVTGRKFRAHSANYFVDELEYLVTKYGIKHFHIVDDNFVVDRERVFEICEEIKKRQLNITWFIFGRIDQLDDEEMLMEIKSAGCVYILFGIESGNQTILDNIKKNLKIDQIKRVCRMCRKIGIHYFNSFIIGNPGDTRETVKQTIDFSISLRSVMAGFNIMIPFPGTPLFNKYYAKQALSITNWKNWCSVGDDLPFEYKHTKLNMKELQKLTAGAYYKYYLRPAQLWRMITFAGLRPSIFLSYIRGGFGVFRATSNWLKKSLTVNKETA